MRQDPRHPTSRGSKTGDDPRSLGHEEGAESAPLLLQSQEILLGPLPPPEALAKYEQACRGAADRIISMAEKQAYHRQALELKVVESNCSAQRRGPLYGLVVVLATLAAGAVLLWNGKDIAGLGTVIAALAAVVATFIVGKWQQRKSLEESSFRDSAKLGDLGEADLKRKKPSEIED